MIKSALRRARRLMHQALGKDLRIRRDLRCPKMYLGSPAYGEYPICPDAIDARSIVYSIGIGEDVSWDLAMIERFGLEVHAFDPTPRSVDWIGSLDLPPGFHFFAEAVADYDGSAAFAAPEEAGYVSYTMLDRPGRTHIDVPVAALSTLMQRFGHERIDILKMDIEGAEYAVVDHILERGLDVRQLLIEFHHRFPDVGLDPTQHAVDRLRAHGYRVFDIDPRGEIYAFLRPGGED